MRKKNKMLCGLLALSLLIGLSGVIIVYKIFPQLLFHIVYDVSQSEVYEGEKEVRRISSGAEYTELFSPKNSYLKSVIFHMGILTEDIEKMDIESKKAVNVKLLNGNGKVLAENNMYLTDMESIAYREFKLEAWVEAGQQYQLLISCADDNNLYLTFGQKDTGPSEHVMLLENNNEINENIYIQYVYGTYSRKLLSMWFVCFFLATFLIGEWVLNYVQVRKSEIQN